MSRSTLSIISICGIFICHLPIIVLAVSVSETRRLTHYHDSDETMQLCFNTNCLVQCFTYLITASRGHIVTLVECNTTFWNQIYAEEYLISEKEKICKQIYVFFHPNAKRI